MGKIVSKLTRPMKNFNVENRAQKIISQEKPVAAPKFKANIKESERLLQEKPESLAELAKKHTDLDEHLKSVYVKSYDSMLEIERPEGAGRPLPLNRKVVEQFEFGFLEPTMVPVGRCTLKQALQFLANYQADPAIWNATKIAIDYKIPEETIRNILEHFRIYQVYMPDKKSKAIFAGPAPLRKEIEDNKKFLDSKGSDKD